MDSLDPYEEEFADIGLSDFIIAHKRVTRHKLERLELTPFQSSLLSRGVQQKMDDQEPKGILYCLLLLVSLVDPLLLDLVLEAALGYTGAIGTSLMDELSGLWPGLTLAQRFLEDQRVEGDELDEEEVIGGC